MFIENEDVCMCVKYDPLCYLIHFEFRNRRKLENNQLHTKSYFSCGSGFCQSSCPSALQTKAQLLSHFASLAPFLSVQGQSHAVLEI